MKDFDKDTGKQQRKSAAEKEWENVLKRIDKMVEQSSEEEGFHFV